MTGSGHQWNARVNEPAPPGISFKTAHYEVRTLRPDDASDRYLSWYLDPQVMHPQNAPTARLTMDELRTHIASFDGNTRHLLGIFEQPGNRHVGCYIINVHTLHRIAKLQMMIGEANSRRKGVATETTTGLIDYLFANAGIAKVTAHVLASNKGFNRVMAKIGMRVEGQLKGEVIEFHGGRRLDQVLYGLLAEEWFARR